MTIEEIARSLPNGFHDAELSGYSISFIKQTAHLDLAVWTGSPTRIETYRPASLDLEGLRFWIIQPPDARYDASAGELVIDIGNVADLDPPPAVQLPPVPPTVPVNWLYVRDWNAFI
ncbi:hypothetical protein [Devosia sp.]|uniref:hypothetical protein n=1 Tax=Devosia sp. TaxID=1871048 RepID=UPI003BAA8B67